MLRKLLDELLDAWINGPDEARTPHGKKFAPSLVMTASTLAAHAHRLARVVAVLIDQGFAVETAPTVRSVLEHGLTVHWIVQYGNDAMFGIVNEECRKRLNAAKTIEELQQVMTLEAGEIVEGLREEINSEKTGADMSARRLDKLCGDFRGGKAVYLAYRRLSDYTHPGPVISSMYVEGEQPLVTRLEPDRAAAPGGWLYHTCVGLVWAARAVDMLDHNHPRRQQLRGAARTLGIPLELAISEETWVRREQDQSKRKRARSKIGGRHS